MSKQHCGDQAQRNFEVYEQLKGQYVDWAAVALFYSALHYVDAWLLTQGARRPLGHSSRAQYLSKWDVPDAVQSAYQSLREVSEVARYENWNGILNRQRLDQLARDEYQAVVAHFA